MITLIQSDLTTTFTNRQTRDGCQPRLTWAKSGNLITGAVLTANGNTCSAPIPVTIPYGVVTDAQGFPTEQVGSDPQTIWVQLSGSPVYFEFSPDLNVQ